MFGHRHWRGRGYSSPIKPVRNIIVAKPQPVLTVVPVEHHHHHCHEPPPSYDDLGHCHRHVNACPSTKGFCREAKFKPNLTVAPVEHHHHHHEPPPSYDDQDHCHRRGKACHSATGFYRGAKFKPILATAPVEHHHHHHHQEPPPSYDDQVYDWVSSGTHSLVPPAAVEVGKDADGSTMYVGRAYHQGDQLPCKVIPRRRQAYVSYNGMEHEVTSYEVMVEKKLTWVRSGHGSVPHGAVVGGHTSSGETLYIGRKHHGGSLCLGKVHPSHGCLYIPYGGQELSFRDYELLVTQ